MPNTGHSWSSKETNALIKEFGQKSIAETIMSFARTFGKKYGLSPAAVKCKITDLRYEETELAELFPAVLFLDIETLPIKAYTWNTWDVNINKEQIIADWSVLCWAAKWYDDPRMITGCLTPKEAQARDDKRICQSMWKLMDDADVIIAQNGKRFDIPKLNTRFWKWHIPQPSSYKLIDTLDAARRAFGMTYNSLDYLGEFLGAGRKLRTEFQLWVDCDLGNKEALARMQEYNENDVTLLEEVYNKMRGWIPNHPKFTAYERVKDVCPVCFSDDIKHIGLYTAAVNQYKEFRCGSCGALWHNTKAEKV
jgi:hypothetical protein